MVEAKPTAESKYKDLVYDEKERFIFFPTKSWSKGDKLNIILYGPPGTGKTYETAPEAMAILTGREINDAEEAWVELKKELGKEEEHEDRRVEFITFHQSYSYEEFVEGLRPKIPETGGNNENSEGVVHQNNKTALTEYEIRPGVLKCIAKRATDDWEKNKENAKNYVLIIDEINRGDISRIFGELITLIEEDKRLGQPHEIKVTLPYSSKTFGLPPNLYIIGTMNTADRSIALIDIALRRRFQFKEMATDYKVLEDEQKKLKGEGFDIDLPKMLERMNERIEYLYDRDHTLGHSYFLGVKDVEGLIKVFRNKIIPLLQEYFFDDWQKIDMVLGGQSKLAVGILKGKDLQVKNLFNENTSDNFDYDKEKKFYSINLSEDKISNLSKDGEKEWAKAFQHIYK